MDLELAGKKAIVTGGSRGIGKQIARVLAQEGVDVAIAARDPERLEATAADLVAETGRTIVPITVDTSDDESVKLMVKKAAEALGGVDILINGAATVGGIAAPPKLAEVTADAFWADMNVKVMGYLRCAQAVAPYMIEKGWGRIVNVASIAGKEGNPTVSHYSAAKAGVIGLTKSLGKELADTNIRVNCITPAVIETEILKQCTQAHIDYMVSKIPMGRVGQAAEVAAMIAWLSSDEVSFSTGAVFDISGGRATY